MLCIDDFKSVNAMDETVKASVCHMLTDAIIDEVGGIEHYSNLHNKILELSATDDKREQQLLTMIGRDISNLHEDEKRHRITVKTIHKILGCPQTGE